MHKEQWQLLQLAYGLIWAEKADKHQKPEMQDCLFRPGSLTKYLQSLGNVSVDVVYEGYHTLLPYEKQAIFLSDLQATQQKVWVRGVRLLVNGLPLVEALTFLDDASIKNEWGDIVHLKSTPLASLVFNKKTIRGKFLISCMSHGFFAKPGFAPPESSGHDELPEIKAEDKELYWIRRSVFKRANAPLILLECFLPDFWHFKASLLLDNTFRPEN